MAEFAYLNGGNSEVQDKQAEAYLYASSGTVGIAATGVIEGLLVTQTPTASGSVLISAGACLNQASLGQGADRLINPSQKTLDIFTTNPVGGLARNDIIEFDSITATIIVHIGTPNATPTDPTVPATSVALARLRHAASATTIPTAKIDTLRVFTTLRGVVGGPWTAYTPTLTGITLGNGSLACAYNLVGKALMLRIKVLFGSTTAITAGVSISLPAGFAAIGAEQDIPCKIFATPGTGQLVGFGNVGASGSVVYPFQPTSTTNALMVQVGTIGFTYGTGSNLIINGTLEVV